MINLKTKFEHWQKMSLLLMICDFIAVCISYFLALFFRFDCIMSEIPQQYLSAFEKFTPAYALVCIVVFCLMGLYRSLWQFASHAELNKIMLATAVTSLIHIGGITIIFGAMPLSYYFWGMCMQFVAILAIRFAYRFILIEKRNPNADSGCNVMLIGAGEAGQMILRDMERSPHIADKVCCIIDDDSNKHNRLMRNVPVVGGRDDILVSVEKYNIKKIYYAIANISAEDKREILNICNETDCEIRLIPSMYQLINGEITVKMLKEVAIEDLLGRETIKMDMSGVYQMLKDKTILVTGGGGSIGSELCRQIAKHSPKRLIIFEVYENNAYDIQQELKRTYPELDLVVLIGSVRDSKRINSVFAQYRPQIVYHAAAHKHVPLMEVSPCEAIKNNAIGTYKTAYAAMRSGCERFVLISTDKAVNPTNIMGASKRLCEMIIQTFDYMIKHGKYDELPMLHAHMSDDVEGMDCSDFENENIIPCTHFSAVRFGNVLGSNGSVIPLFKKQIEEGGPVTVTAPDIIRYFLSIPEAISLVLQASILGEGSEIYVLDMGEPVKIDTLARNLIKLSGLKPDVDIKIEYTGLRPGEKLYEEKLMAEEGLQRTENNLIHIGKPIPFEYEKFIDDLKRLMDASYAEDEDDIYDLVKEVVKTFNPVGFHPVAEKKSVCN